LIAAVLFGAASEVAEAQVTVQVLPAGADLFPNQTAQFAAAVKGTANTAVTWSVNPNVGGVSSTGLYTAPGTVSSQQSVTVIATSVADPTQSGTANVTLFPAPTVSVSPPSATLTASQTQQFTATVTGNADTAVTWAINPNVGSISPAGLYTAPSTISSSQNVTVTATSVADTGASGTGTVTLSPPAPTLQLIAVTPSSPSIAKGLTQQFTATGTYSDSSTQNLTSSVTWASATPGVATITAGGLATGAGTGSSTISATSGSVVGSAMLTVTAATLQSIAVTPANPSISKGATQQFTATGTYSDSSTQNLTASVTWASATPGVATITAGGLATGAGAGTSTISATSGSVVGSTVLTVTAATLQSIALTPSNSTIIKGATQQYTATGTYRDSSTQNLTGQVMWASATPGVATITAGGLATGAGTGTSTISATSGSVVGSTVLTVTAATLQSIALTPPNSTIIKGATQQYTATGTYSDSSTQNLTGQVTWASATPGVVTIAAGGLATGVGIGTTNITATLGTVTSNAANLTVTTPPNLTAAPTSLSFSARTDDTGPPAGQSISVFSAVTGIAFTATASTVSGNWLAVRPASGQTPGVVTVTVNTTSLSAGNYTGQITITAANTNPPSVAIPVTITIHSVPPPTLNVAPAQVTVTAVQGGSAVQKQLVVSNLGGGTLNFNAVATGGSWLTLSTSSESATTGAPVLVQYILNPQGLNPATYQGQIAVSTLDGTQNQIVGVTLAVNAQPQSIVLTQTGLQFTAISQGTAPPAQTFTILNGGLGTMDWTAAVETLSGGSGWLNATPANGSSIAGTSSAPSVAVGVNPQNLAPGVYYGLVQVAAAGAGNSPQVVSVELDVLSTSAAPAPLISSVGLIVIGSVGGAIASNTTTLSNLANQSTSYASTASTEDGANWLAVSPPSGVVPASGSAQVTLQFNSAGLSTGIRNGTVRLAFPDGTVQTISVVSVLDAGAIGTSQSNVTRLAGNCAPNSIAVVINSLESGFTVTASTAVPLQVQIVDSCGNTLQSGAEASVSFSNNDPSLTMVPGNGTWNGTWTPRAAGSAVTVLVTAFLAVGETSIGGQATITGTVQAASGAASASPGFLANSASYLLPGQVTAGSWVSIFGDRLADSESQVNAAPYPNALAGTQVLLGETPLPVLFVSAGQVNALIPYSLSSSVNHPLLIQRDGTTSVPLNVTQADLLPAIYSTDQSGTGQGAIQIANTSSLAAPLGAYPGSQPVQPGQFITIFASGLGSVLNTPADGAAAPSSPPFATTTLTPTVTIGGVPATVIQYSGLAPGQVGLYQVNVQVPPGAPIGGAVPVVISIGGDVSNTVTIAVQAAQ